MGDRSADLKAFLAARDFLLGHREDYETAYRDFRWPDLSLFNWAVDYFDTYALENSAKIALWIVEEDGSETKYSFAEISRRSNQVGNFLRRHSVGRGDRVIVMLPNDVAIWEVMLAALKIGAVIIPAATLLTTEDLHDRIQRANTRHVIATSAAVEKFQSLHSQFTGIVVGETVKGWHNYRDAYNEPATITEDPSLHVTDPFILYFTSGTTSSPKLVPHTRQSYPVGHLATMYWIGIRPDDIHLNISSPGWAKHAWSSFFAPWNAGATIFVHNYGRFNARKTLEQVERCEVTTLCAPPTVWRSFVLEDLSAFKMKIRDLAGAGEPLNPEIMEKVRRAWGVTIRDGFGQTENVCLLANFPGQAVKPGAVGKPSPGHDVVLLDGDGRETDEGEIALKLEPRPLSLFSSYMDDPSRTVASMQGGYYRTGDVASRDSDGYFTYIGRADDVFKSSDYRLSPFELESALVEHDMIAEVAVVPSPEAIRWNVPKAFILLKPGIEPTKDTALEIFRFVRKRLGPYKRIRRIEFSDLPKTISGKIRRVQLRAVEKEARGVGLRRENEYWEEDFTDL
jgi:acetyl-CoA synthetase